MSTGRRAAACQPAATLRSPTARSKTAANRYGVSIFRAWSMQRAYTNTRSTPLYYKQSGTTTVSANASDNVGVAGVQFLLDGVALGAEDTAAPYSISWDTSTATNGSHALTARARDAAGNQTTSAAVTVTVSNTAPTGLVAAYGFNEGTGTIAADASGHGNTGTVSNTTWSASGKYGGALSFNGVNAWVTVADAASLDLTGALTLEAWVNPIAIVTGRTVILKEAGTEEVYS